MMELGSVRITCSLSHMFMWKARTDLLHFPAKPSIIRTKCAIYAHELNTLLRRPRAEKRKREMTSRFVNPHAESSPAPCTSSELLHSSQTAGPGAESPTISSCLSDQDLWLQMFHHDRENWSFPDSLSKLSFCFNTTVWRLCFLVGTQELIRSSWNDEENLLDWSVCEVIFKSNGDLFER